MKARQCDCDLRDLLRERLKLDGSPHSSVQFAPRGFDRPVLRSPIAGLLLKRSFSKVQGAYCSLLSRICCSERVVAVSRQPIHLGLLFPKALRYPFHEWPASSLLLRRPGACRSATRGATSARRALPLRALST